LLTAMAVAFVVPVAILLTRPDLVSKVREVGIGSAIAKGWRRVRTQGLVETLKSARAPDDVLAGSATLPYSVFDTLAMPPREDAAARAVLPEYIEVPGIDVAQLPASQEETRTFDTWHRSGGDELSSKYSSLDQITAQNVRFLEPAWSYTSGSDLGDSTKIGGATVETNPVVVGNSMFLTNVDGDLIALDAESGKEIWRRALPAPVARRGLVWEPNADFSRSRLFVPSSKGVFAVNAATGEVLKTFGKDGVVGSGTSLIAPLIVDDRLIVATLAPAVEAYDLATGALQWSRPLLRKSPTESGLAGGAPWGGMSADVKRHLVFVSTGNPRPAFIGTTRLGKNDYASSVVAIDTRTGSVVWSFQETNHDLWDLDIAAAPILTTIVKDGRKVDVLAALTKRGNTLLLDRDQGKAIFGYRLKRAPVSTVPGEQTASHQPVFSLPEPYAAQEFWPDQITERTDSATLTVTRKLRGATYGLFEPPRIGGKIAMYGLGGGAEWPGGAVDQKTGTLYVPSSQFPWVIRVEYADIKANAKSGADLAGDARYQADCAGCHGTSRRGSAEWAATGDAYMPALTGITVFRRQDQLQSTTYFREQHAGVAVDSRVDAATLDTLYRYFRELDRRSDQQRSFVFNAFFQTILDDRGNPGSKAPWGLLTAIDLNTGRKRWQVPFGQRDLGRSDGAPVRGLVNTGGVAVTAGGVLFATGATDNTLRAYDALSGAELWSYQLPAAGSTIPTVYAVNGTQYVVVVATGGILRGYSGRSDRVIAFKLPRSRR
jgi:quinoprotein glucose dehydrogenase